MLKVEKELLLLWKNGRILFFYNNENLFSWYAKNSGTEGTYTNDEIRVMLYVKETMSDSFYWGVIHTLK